MLVGQFPGKCASRAARQAQKMWRRSGQPRQHPSGLLKIGAPTSHPHGAEGDGIGVETETEAETAASMLGSWFASCQP